MHFGVKIACALAIAGMWFGFSARAVADPLTVKTEQGKIHGKLISNGNVRAYLGIPYAAPPIGGLRWKAPQPPAHWKGVRGATSYEIGRAHV